MLKYFPTDCRECEHYHSWDMSIDDWTNVCDVLKVQVDDCDIDRALKILCPLELESCAEHSGGGR